MRVRTNQPHPARLPFAVRQQVLALQGRADKLDNTIAALQKLRNRLLERADELERTCDTGTKLKTQLAREWYERKRRLEEERALVFEQVLQNNRRIRAIERRIYDRQFTSQRARVS